MLVFADDTFTNCSAKKQEGPDDGLGGALCVVDWADTSLDLIRCSFSSNAADEDGGCIYVRNINQTLFTNCTATKGEATNGGWASIDGIYIAIVRGCNGTACNSSEYGGWFDGVFIDTLTIGDCRITTCNAKTLGGGISIGATTGALTIRECSLEMLTADRGGGLCIYDDENSTSNVIASIALCLFFTNSAIWFGKDVAMFRVSHWMTKEVFQNCTSSSGTNRILLCASLLNPDCQTMDDWIPSTNPPSPDPDPGNDPEPTPKKTGLSTTAIIVIGVGVGFGVLLIIGAGVGIGCYVHHRKKSSRWSSQKGHGMGDGTDDDVGEGVSYGWVDVSLSYEGEDDDSSFLSPTSEQCNDDAYSTKTDKNRKKNKKKKPKARNDDHLPFNNASSLRSSSRKR